MIERELASHQKQKPLKSWIKEIAKLGLYKIKINNFFRNKSKIKDISDTKREVDARG